MLFHKPGFTKQIPTSKQGQRFYKKALQVNPFASPAYDEFFIPAQNMQGIHDDRLSRYQFRVLSHLISRKRRNKAYIDDTNMQIANTLKISYSCVQKALQLLETLGYICRAVKRDSKNYRNTERKIYLAYDYKPKNKAYQNTVIERQARKKLDIELDIVRTENDYAELDTPECFAKLRQDYQAMCRRARAPV